MREHLTKIAQYVPGPMRTILRRVYERFFPPATESIMYRVELFGELVALVAKNSLKGKRILEIGPQDGLDSNRLASLMPSELVMIDLPEKRTGNEVWLSKLGCPHKYIEANFMYMSKEEYEGLGKFGLVWCTGVLDHNADQFRALQKRHKRLEF